MANKYIVADPAGCISCQTCMAACIDKHDVSGDVAAPRLNVAQTLRVSAPIACHHCDDAPCVASCPTGALYQDTKNQRVGVHEGSCIGCRSCVMACPFGAIRVEIVNKPVMMGNLIMGGSQQAAVIKCDLCVDRANGPACVEFCPTHSLFLVSAEELEQRSYEKREKAAGAEESISSVPLNIF